MKNSNTTLLEGETYIHLFPRFFSWTSIALYLFLFNLIYSPTLAIAQCKTDEHTEDICTQTIGLHESINDNRQLILDNIAIHPDGSINNSSTIDTTTWNSWVNEIPNRTIPVVFHILHLCGPENISDAQIHDALQTVNEDFAGVNQEMLAFQEFFDPTSPKYIGINGYGSIGLRFELATQDKFGNASNGIVRTRTPYTSNGSIYERDLKTENNWPRDQYLNIYVVDDIGVQASAYAQFPSTVANDPILDGVVIDHRYLGYIGTSLVKYNTRRHILTHEIAHCFGLEHTWGRTNGPGVSDNCNDTAPYSADDDICDTPNTIGFSSSEYYRQISAIYPDSIQFDYTEQDGSTYSVNTNSFLSDYIISLSDWLIGNDFSSIPNSCNSNFSSDCIDPNTPDNIFNFMDYGSEFMFSKGQINMMIACLNSTVAERNKIGQANQNALTYIPDSLASITFDTYNFEESILNDNTIDPSGILIKLSEGNFLSNNLVLSTNPDLSNFGLTPEVEILSNTQARIWFSGIYNASAPFLDGIDSLEIELDTSQIFTNGKALWNASANSLKLSGFSLFMRDSPSLFGSVDGPIRYYYQDYAINPDDRYVNPDVCLDNEIAALNGFDFVYEDVALNPLFKFLYLVNVPTGQIDEAGFYFAADSDFQVEILCFKDSIKNQIALVNSNDDIVNIASSTEYRSVSNFSTSTELLTESFLENLNVLDGNGQAYLACKVPYLGCDDAYFYSWIHLQIEKDSTGFTNICLKETEFGNEINPTSYVIDPLQDCGNPTVVNQNYLTISRLAIDGNTINTSSGNGYTDYTTDPTKNIIVDALQTYPLEIDATGISNTQNELENEATYIIYLDKNQNDIFESDERILIETLREQDRAGTAYQGIDLSLSLGIPPLPAGNYKMRIILSIYPYNNGFEYYILNPCNEIDYGEIEDYLLVVENGCSENSENLRLFVNVILEGAYLGWGSQIMSDHLFNNHIILLPEHQPYSNPPYNYPGTETLNNNGTNAVDWVLIELRLDPADPASTIDRRAGILRPDGKVVDPIINKLGLSFCNIDPDESYYVVVRHRNHLDIVSASPIKANQTIDFTRDLNSVYVGSMSGLVQLKDMGTGEFAMFAGDYNQDLYIQTSDYDVWKNNPAENNTYSIVDGNLDGVIQTTDYDLWFANKAKMTPPWIQY